MTQWQIRDKKVNKLYASLKFKVLRRLGDKCVRCGYSDVRALQIDHINGNGAEERNKYGSYSIRKRILEMSEEEMFSKYQLLCANCNQIKRMENKEYPINNKI